MDVIINNTLEIIPPSDAISLISQHDFWFNTLLALGADPHYTPLATLLSHGIVDSEFLPESRILDQLLPTGREWLIISPIHWEATHHDAMIVAHGDSLGLTKEQGRMWFIEISQLLARDGFKLVYYTPTHWLLGLPDDCNLPALKSPNLSEVTHQSMMPILATLDPTLRWQRLLTELQMFLSSHPLNTGKHDHLSVNGVWFWGGGTLPSALNRPFWTDAALFHSVFPNASSLDKIQLNVRNKNNANEAVIALQHPDDSLIAQIETIKTKHPTRWYWNNCAYQQRVMPWYQRLSCLWSK